MIWRKLEEKMNAHSQQTIRSNEQIYTYGEVLNTVSEFSEKLSAQKYGIICEHEINSIIALLACFSAGKTAVPMSYRYGENHCEKIMRQTDLSYIITDRSGALRVEQIKEENKERENLDDIALIMSTSGTTGYPKCAMLSNYSLLSNAESILDYFPICDTDSILIVRPIYHCAVLVGELLVSLMRGLNIVLYDKAFNPIEIVRIINRRKITVMCATPTVFSLTAKLCGRKIPLRLIAISGEILTESAKQTLCDAFADTEIYHVYGLTEAGPRVSCLPPHLFLITEPNVGFPIKGVKVKIQNGELLVKSPSVMRGYYGDKNATNRVIKDDWLYTGDMAELKDGRIVIKGRKDDLIIRSGMNIYPQEIENEILKADFITQAIAYQISDAGAAIKIGAKVVVNRKTSLNEIRKFCVCTMPGYMIPDEIQIVSEIPKNGSGKVIRKNETRINSNFTAHT